MTDNDQLPIDKLGTGEFRDPSGVSESKEISNEQTTKSNSDSRKSTGRGNTSKEFESDIKSDGPGKNRRKSKINKDDKSDNSNTGNDKPSPSPLLNKTNNLGKLILAPSGTGKTFHVDKGSKFEDGDKILEDLKVKNRLNFWIDEGYKKEKKRIKEIFDNKRKEGISILYNGDPNYLNADAVVLIDEDIYNKRSSSRDGFNPSIEQHAKEKKMYDNFKGKKLSSLEESESMLNDDVAKIDDKLWIAAHIGAGKSTLASKDSNLYDIDDSDDLMPDSVKKELAQLKKDNRWSEVNMIRDEYIRKWLKTVPKDAVILSHSVDDSKRITGKDSLQGVIILPDDEFNKRKDTFDDERARLAEMNRNELKQYKGNVYESFDDFFKKKAIIVKNKVGEPDSDANVRVGERHKGKVKVEETTVGQTGNPEGKRKYCMFCGGNRNKSQCSC